MCGALPPTLYGILEYWNTMEYWNIRILGKWNIGILVTWWFSLVFWGSSSFDLPTWGNLRPSWVNLGKLEAILGQLEAGLLHTWAQIYTFAASQFEAKLEPTWATCGQLEANLGQLGAMWGHFGGHLVQHEPTWSQHEPTWSQHEATWSQLRPNLGQHRAT